ASAVVVLRPAQLMSSKVAEMLPTEVATAAGLKYLGFDPADVDEVVAFADISDPAAPPAYGLTMKFNKPFKGSSIPQEARAHAQLGELNGKKYLQSQHPMLPSFYGPNNKTLVVAPDETLRQMVEAQGQSPGGPILDRVRQAPAGSDLYVAVDVASLRPMLGMYLGMAKTQAPPDFQPFFDLPNFITAAELTVNLSGPGPTSLVAHANDEAAAEQVMTLIADANQKYQANLKAQLAEQAASEDPIERAFAQYAERVSAKWMTPFMPTRDGASLTLFHREGLDESQKTMLVAAIGIAAAMGLPATMSAREAARRVQAANHMKQIMLAFHNYHSMRRTLPAHASYSDDGKPLLSWRVHILPFVEGGHQYNQFHLDEPWDSEHNKTLIAQMPEVYTNPNLPLEPGKTNYLAIVGKECAFDGSKTGLGFQNITDGTSKTIAFVEADPAQAVEWTKPDDLEFNPDDPKAGLGNVRPGGWNAAFCDGSVQFISDNVDPQVLKALFTRAGGEVVDVPRAAPAPPAAQDRYEFRAR
ncbi:MAG: DUF1559 domain-containing protein, partial [Planctomycetes bacterium]|nr:DUF1559 domain-containing protein [Planctomycetota bacterium]